MYINDISMPYIYLYLEHVGQAGVDAVHPGDHPGEPLLVAAPLLRDLLQLGEQALNPRTRFKIDRLRLERLANRFYIYSNS